MPSRKAFLLRIDPQLWEDLELWAKDELRSVNGQVEYVLKQAVLKRKGSKRSQGASETDESRSRD
ncbi:MAG: Arc family DNA binding domain-containing protein [Verrucomicrobia bacterium]|nr:MAG: Arc family DNA binding domain-containing protein [Verrucomicrobiota bacterium]